MTLPRNYFRASQPSFSAVSLIRKSFRFLKQRHKLRGAGPCAPLAPRSSWLARSQRGAVGVIGLLRLDRWSYRAMRGRECGERALTSGPNGYRHSLPTTSHAQVYGSSDPMVDFDQWLRGIRDAKN